MSERDEIERVNDAWNRLVDGGWTGDLDPGDAEAIRRLSRLAGAPRPRSAFVAQLREHLMHATASPTGAVPRRVEGGWSSHHSGLPHLLDQRWRARHERRWGFGAVATVALVIVTLGGLVGVLVYGPGRDEGTPTPTARVAAAETSTPPSLAEPKEHVERLGWGNVLAGDIPEGLSAPFHVSLFNWTIQPGFKSVIAGEQVGDGPGLGIDVVIEGIYQGTFDAPVRITRAPQYAVARNEYVASGEMVELARGDAVAFDYAQGRSIKNPLDRTALRFERIVVTPVDVLPTPSAAGQEVTATFNSEGTVPADALNDPSGMIFELDLFDWLEGQPLPEPGRDWMIVIDSAPSPNPNFFYRVKVYTGGGRG